MQHTIIRITLAVMILFVGTGLTNFLHATNLVGVRNNAPCAVTLSLLLSDGTVKGPGTFPSGTSDSTCLPAGVTVSFILVGGTLFPVPAPGVCIPTGFICPAFICGLACPGQCFEFI